MIERLLRDPQLTARQALVLLQLKDCLKRYACVRCRRAPRQGRNHYCAWCNAKIRKRL